MTKKDIYRIIDVEINWCIKNPQNVPDGYRDGFIDGMKQVKRIIKKIKLHDKDK